MSLANKLDSHTKGHSMNNYYTDCDNCKESHQVTQFVYDYLAQGGQADVYCPDCERELWWAEEVC